MSVVLYILLSKSLLSFAVEQFSAVSATTIVCYTVLWNDSVLGMLRLLFGTLSWRLVQYDSRVDTEWPMVDTSFVAATSLSAVDCLEIHWQQLWIIKSNHITFVKLKGALTRCLSAWNTVIVGTFFVEQDRSYFVEPSWVPSCWTTRWNSLCWTTRWNFVQE